MEPLKNQTILLNSTLQDAEGNNYDYDILNGYENINMDIQFILNIFLLLFTIKNLINVKKWCNEKKVKPYQLYCINANSILILIC